MSVNKCAAFAAAFLLAAPASASTIYSGVIDESDGRNVPAGGADFVLSDFNTSVGNPDLDIGGDVQIYGYVAHQAGSSSNWKDGWSMDFGATAYDVVFEWTRNTKIFDGTLIVGGVSNMIDNLASGSLSFAGLSGEVTFLLDPVAGNTDLGESANWRLTATQVAPVPLPAGLPLLLVGLGGLALARRRG